MYRRILVPVDGSASSNLGLQHALSLAKDQRARVRLLNVVDEMAVLPMMYGYPADISTIIESMQEAGKKAIEDGNALAKKAHVEADTAIIDARGRVVSDAILEQAKKFRADVIVMGTHGRRGLNRLLLGSDAERVLRSAEVPVLLVKGNGGERPGRKRRGARKTIRQ
jgi:nucleotide-binding universal stress UspA family protein